MNAWKTALTQLVMAGRVMVYWTLKFEERFLMAVSNPDRFGENSIGVEEPVYYDDIVFIEIFRKMELGKLCFSNDLNRCRELLSVNQELLIEDVPGGIRVQLKE